MRKTVPVQRILRIFTRGAAAAVVLLASQVEGQELFVSSPVSGNVTSFPAHSQQELCFVVGGPKLTGKVVFVTMEGPHGEVGGKPAIADGNTEVCFMAPAIKDAGEWKDCVPPRDVIPEAYLVSARYDTIGNGGAASEASEGSIESELLNVTRTVERKNPRPEECQGLDGDWTWSFNSGVLECAKLPMKVTLPGFDSSVTIETDGATDTKGVKMTVTGDKTGERLVLIVEPDEVVRGKSYLTFQGFQDVSKLLDQRKAVDGKYTIHVINSNLLEGNLDVHKMAYQGDVCSIFWPITARRKS
ncbi:MAG: hypothetical protein K0U98_01290 [Deltaproteobacteria bacterium]|nr:hypothetical protein [Deltaproteobacteria bacterium]